MSKRLSAGFLMLPVPFIVRYTVIAGSDTPFFLLASVQTWEKIVYLVCLAGVAVAFWNQFVRRRCPRCRQYDYKRTSSEELDRWAGTKKVRERGTDQRSFTRTVSTTFVKMKNVYHCRQCEYQWHEIIKQELR